MVDVARIALRAGDVVQPLADAYALLLSKVADRREDENHRFGELLVDWIKTGSTSDVLLPVEEVLERIIGPLASEVPVLVVVVDGMSVPVWRDILEDLSRHSWVTLEPAETSDSAWYCHGAECDAVLPRQPAVREAHVRGRCRREASIRGPSRAHPSEQDAIPSGALSQSRAVSTWQSGAG